MKGSLCLDGAQRFCSSKRAACALTLLLLSAVPLEIPSIAAEDAVQVYEINTVMMETTFRIEGKVKGETKIGTVFIVGKPEKGDSSKFRSVLVTAAHVLDEITEDHAVLHLRKRTGENEWKQFTHRLRIKNEGKTLWVRHPDSDVAAMYIELPEGVIQGQLGTQLLADDDDFQRFDIHPGDNLICLGFPAGLESSKDAGFPILRSGRIASYPLLPTRQRKTFLFDFEVFGGNSGGPVYLVDSNRIYNRKAHLGQTVQILVGLVSEQIIVFQKPEKADEKPTKPLYPLKMAEVVHASLIKDTIALLE